jgi:hypothetical protein
LKREEDTIGQFISAFPAEPITGKIAVRGGYLKREYGPSHGISLADALIAATALEKGYEVATLNVKHYPMLHRLKPAYAR